MSRGAVRRPTGLRQYVESTFGGVDECRKTILADFFRHAFDGSGADNFFDAGSCIDGRLTSAWNWCSKIEKVVLPGVFRWRVSRVRRRGFQVVRRWELRGHDVQVGVLTFIRSSSLTRCVHAACRFVRTLPNSDVVSVATNLHGKNASSSRHIIIQ